MLTILWNICAVTGIIVWTIIISLWVYCLFEKMTNVNKDIKNNILEAIGFDEISAKELQEKVKLPMEQFYAIMAELEDEKLVVHYDNSKMIEIIERTYTRRWLEY